MSDLSPALIEKLRDARDLKRARLAVARKVIEDHEAEAKVLASDISQIRTKLGVHDTEDGGVTA